MKDLTNRPQEVLDIIINFRREKGFPPTAFELASLMGCSSPNAAAVQMKALQRKGVITIAPGVSRGITINIQSRGEEAISLLRSLVDGDEYAREHAIAFLERCEVLP